MLSGLWVALDQRGFTADVPERACHLFVPSHSDRATALGNALADRRPSTPRRSRRGVVVCQQTARGKFVPFCRRPGLCCHGTFAVVTVRSLTLLPLHQARLVGVSPSGVFYPSMMI